MSAPRTLSPQVPTDILELRAAEQRRRLHNDISELRETVRERVNVKRQARQYLVPAAAVASVFGLVLGYGVGECSSNHL